MMAMTMKVQGWYHKTRHWKEARARENPCKGVENMHTSHN